MKKAIYINFISRYSVVFFQLLLNLVMARIVSPEDYGVIAIITVFTSFFAIFSDAGIGAGVIQFKSLGSKDFSDLYSITVYLGLLLALLFIGVGYVVSVIYHNQVYVPLGALLSCSVFFNTINTVPKAMLMREKRFLEVAIRTVTVTIISGIITIIFACLGGRYYAVAGFSVLQSLFSFLWNRIRADIRFRIRFETEAIKTIYSFSMFQFLFNFINYFSVNTDTLLIGKTMGEVSVGLYNKAYQLITYPGSMFAGVITPVLHPILSEYQNEKAVLYEYLIKILRVLLYISIFVSLICYAAPREIICILYGNNWDKAIVAFKLLSLSIVTKMCNSIVGSFFLSLGKSKTLFYTGSLSAVLIVGLTIVGIMNGTIESVALFVSIAYMINFWFSYFMLIVNGFKFKFFDFIKIIIKPYIIYVVMIILCNFVKIPSLNIYLGLLVKILLITVTYGILIFIVGERKNVQDSIKLIMIKRKEKTP